MNHYENKEEASSQEPFNFVVVEQGWCMLYLYAACPNIECDIWKMTVGIYSDVDQSIRLEEPYKLGNLHSKFLPHSLNSQESPGTNLIFHTIDHEGQHKNHKAAGMQTQTQYTVFPVPILPLLDVTCSSLTYANLLTYFSFLLPLLALNQKYCKLHFHGIAFSFFLFVNQWRIQVDWNFRKGKHWLFFFWALVGLFNLWKTRTLHKYCSSLKWQNEILCVFFPLLTLKVPTETLPFPFSTLWIK